MGFAKRKIFVFLTSVACVFWHLTDADFSRDWVSPAGLLDWPYTCKECSSGEVVWCQKSKSTFPRIKDYFCLYRCYILILVPLCRQGNSITCLTAGHVLSRRRLNHTIRLNPCQVRLCSSHIWSVDYCARLDNGTYATVSSNVEANDCNRHAS